MTLTTAQGEETFEYYYVVTQDFPQISRCMKGNFNDSFIGNAAFLSDVDADGDGFVSSYDCDDNNPTINPLATDDPTTSIDESCGATLSTQILELKDLGYYINSNPNNGNFSIISTNSEKYEAKLFSITGQLIKEKEGVGVIEMNNIGSSGVYLLRIKSQRKIVGTTKIVVK